MPINKDFHPFYFSFPSPFIFPSHSLSFPLVGWHPFIISALSLPFWFHSQQNTLPLFSFPSPLSLPHKQHLQAPFFFTFSTRSGEGLTRELGWALFFSSSCLFPSFAEIRASGVGDESRSWGAILGDQEACKGLLLAWKSRLVDDCWFVLLGECWALVCSWK